MVTATLAIIFVVFINVGAAAGWTFPLARTLILLMGMIIGVAAVLSLAVDVLRLVGLIA